MHALQHLRVRNALLPFVDRDAAKLICGYLHFTEWVPSYQLRIPLHAEWTDIVGVGRDAVYWRNGTTLFKNQEILLQRRDVKKVTCFHDKWLLVEFREQITIFDEHTRFSTTFKNINSACVWGSKVLFVEMGRLTIRIYDVVTKTQRQWMSWQEFKTIRRNHDTVVAKCEYGWTNIHTNKGTICLARYEYDQEIYIVQRKHVSRENDHGLELVCAFRSIIVTTWQYKHYIIVILQNETKYVIDMVHHTFHTIILPSEYVVTHNQIYALSAHGIDVFE